MYRICVYIGKRGQPQATHCVLGASVDAGCFPLCLGAGSTVVSDAEAWRRGRKWLGAEYGVLVAASAYVIVDPCVSAPA